MNILRQPRRIEQENILQQPELKNGAQSTIAKKTKIIKVISYNSPAVPHSQERRVDSDAFSAIAHDALASYKIALIKRELPEHAALEGLVQQMQNDEQGIPLSVARQTLYEQYRAAGMEIPFSYIDKAIERKFPDAQKVQMILGSHNARPTRKMMRVQLSAIMKSYAERCLNALEEQFPASTFSYTIRKRYSFQGLCQWAMRTERVSFYESRPGEKPSIFRPRGIKIGAVMYDGRETSAMLTTYHTMNLFSNRFVIGGDTILNEWRRTVQDFDFHNNINARHYESNYGPKWKVTYHESVHPA